MNNFFRFVITAIVFVAAFFFIYWVPLSLIPYVHELGISYFISLGCAAFAAWYVWRKSASADAGLVQCVIYGAFIIGGISFCAGFFGPMIFAPGANQGPMLGLFITGPLGFLAGGIGGFVYWLVKKKRAA
ncbi:MAG TPA: multidrug ABC transporter permease [candidate division Zixibacteria bacterium]|nr:multidrug ABC transporter permease [candidate division Zixibacteria bacterium]